MTVYQCPTIEVVFPRAIRPVVCQAWRTDYKVGWDQLFQSNPYHKEGVNAYSLRILGTGKITLLKFRISKTDLKYHVRTRLSL